MTNRGLFYLVKGVESLCILKKSSRRSIGKLEFQEVDFLEHLPPLCRVDRLTLPTQLYKVQVVDSSASGVVSLIQVTPSRPSSSGHTMTLIVGSFDVVEDRNEGIMENIHQAFVKRKTIISVGDITYSLGEPRYNVESYYLMGGDVAGIPKDEVQQSKGNQVHIKLSVSTSLISWTAVHESGDFDVDSPFVNPTPSTRGWFRR